MSRWLQVRSFPARAALALAALVTTLSGTSASAAALAAPPAQDAATGAPPATAPDTSPGAVTPPKPASDPGGAADAPAVALSPREVGEAALDRAAHFQRGNVPHAAPASLHGSFHVGVRDKDGSMIQADVERWFTVSPECLLTHRTESFTGSASSIGWNGTQAWFRDDKDQRVVRYTDDPETFAVDLDDLRQQVRLTRLLLTASVMDALRPRLAGVTATGTGRVTDLDGAAHVTDLVTARTPDELYPPPVGAPPRAGAGPRQLELRFAIDHETGALWELQVSAVGRDDIAALRLRFDYHGPSASGLVVPGNIRVYEGTGTRESLSLGVTQPGELLLFDVDAPIDAALFDPPADVAKPADKAPTGR